MNFELAPASSVSTLILAAFSFLLLAITAVSIWTTWSMTTLGALRVADGEIELRVPVFGRTMPIASLDREHARIVTLDATSDLRPRWRTNGLGLPGYQIGWYRLRDGSKALLALTSREHVLYIPTHEGFSLLVSVDRPEEALRALRAGE
jgi:PH (Pleckstrin Homology) domain-containing protein